MSDSFETEIVKKVATIKGVNKLIAEMSPWLRYQFVINKGITNMAFFLNTSTTTSKFNISTAKNIKEDKENLVLKYFKTPVMET